MPLFRRTAVNPARARARAPHVAAALGAVLVASGVASAGLAPAVTLAAAARPASGTAVTAPGAVGSARVAPASSVTPTGAHTVHVSSAAGASAVDNRDAAEHLAEELAGTAHGLTCTVVAGAKLCTHGDDRHTAAGTSGSGSSPAVPIGCAGDGRSDNRVQVVYVRQSDRPDRFGSVFPTIRQDVDVANGVFSRSSDGRRALRVVTDSGCTVAVDRVTVSPGQAGSFSETVGALRAAGRNRIDRKYLVFMDNSNGCGLGEYYLDDRGAISNRNNDGNMYAVVYTPCWDGVTVAHELTHMFGGVQASAPHSTGNYGHCTDQYDVMCYRDGSGLSMTLRCAYSQATILDCGRDDYFSVGPAGGSYLAQHWNTASNSFLIGGGPAIPVPPSPPTNVSGSRSGDNVRMVWGTPDQARSGISAFDVVDLAANAVLMSVPGNARSATVTLTPWRTYRIAVVARNAAGSSEPAGGQQFMVGRPPDQPTGTMATYTVQQTAVHIQLAWSAPQHVSSYAVFRDGRPVGVTTSATWVEPGTSTVGQRYTYSVQARNDWGVSPMSAGATALGL
jgi:hypothetical protein